MHSYPLPPGSDRRRSGGIALLDKPWATSLLVACAYAVAIAAVTFRTELTANSDGAFLLAAAVSFADGHGFLSFTGDAMPTWPPLYPALIGLFVALGVDLRWAAWLVNALTAFWYMWAVVQWLRFSISNHWLIALGLLGCALLHPVLGLFSEVHPDALLLALSLHSMVFGARWLRGASGAMVPGLVLAALATLAKYQGVAVLGAWGLFVLLRCSRGEPGACVRRLALVGAAALPLASWLWRNISETGTLTGSRAAPHSLREYLLHDAGPRTLDAVTNWFIPQSGPLWLRTLIGTGLLAILAAGLLRAAVVYPQSRSRHLGVLALSAFALVYVAVTLAASAASGAWGVPRYMAVVAPVLVLLVAGLLDTVFERLSVLPATAVGLVCAAMLLAVPLIRSVDLAARIQHGRPGYQYGDWYTHLRPAVRQFDFRGPVLSNTRGFVWLLTRQPEHWIAREQVTAWRMQGDGFAREQIAKLLRAPTPFSPPRGETLYFVEVFRGDDDAVTSKDLDGVFQLVPESMTADGAIWRLE